MMPCWTCHSGEPSAAWVRELDESPREIQARPDAIKLRSEIPGINVESAKSGLGRFESRGEVNLAAEVDAFVRSMPRVMTDRERIAVGLLAEVEAQRSRTDTRGQESTPGARGAPKGRGE